MKVEKFLVLCFLVPTIFSSCPNGSVEFRDYCYFLQQESNSFFYAETACNKLGGNLASVHDGFTNSFLAANVNSTYYTDFWIGLNSLTNPESWSWTDNTTVNFNEWAPFARNLSFGCTSMIKKTGQWNTTNDCRSSKSSVCAVPLNSTTYLHRKCSVGFHYYEPTNSCYGGYNIDEGIRYTFTAADWECEDHRAELASLHSENEAKFVSAVGGYWIGLHSHDNQKTWQWTDGSPVDYLPWMQGHPWKPILTCAQLYYDSGKPSFVDSICSDVTSFVCKKSL